MFSGHVETKILKFSPASATKVRLPGRGRKGMGRKEREGKNREGKGGEGEGRGKKGWGVSICPPPPLRNVLLRPWYTLDYVINVHGRLLFSEKISRMDALIRWWTLINFRQNSRVDVYSIMDAY